MQTIVELPEFLRRVDKLLGESERQSLISYVAEFPKSGVIMRGTGGIRKRRWAREGGGKSGGVRVVYYFHNEQIPLYLLTVFGKGEKSNLSPSERKELAGLVKLLIKSAGL
jgi:hypothetical protein